MSSINLLHQRAKKMRDALVRYRLELLREIPMRFFAEDGVTITYETPIERAWPGMAYDEYRGIGYDEDGVDA